MKYCPECRSTYTDKSLSYCLQDGYTLRDFRDANSQEKTAVLNKEAQETPKQELKEHTDKDINENKAESRTNNFVRKSFSTIVWVIIGLLLGVGGIYLWQTMNEKPAEVPLLIAQTDNAAKNSMDTLKYRAETSPESIVKLYEAALPNDASDFYILGRAFLRLKNYEEAKKNFILARNNLSEIKDSENRVILDTDISLGLMISQDVSVQTSYERVRKTSPLAESFNLTNTNK